MKYLAAPFSAFRQNFPKSVPQSFVKECYLSHLLASLAKDPSYIWAHKTEIAISCRTSNSSKAFMLGDLTKKAIFQFGKCLNLEEVMGW